MIAYDTKQTRLVTDRMGYVVEMVVVHETAGKEPGDLNWLVGSGEKSVNWYVGRSGKVTCLDPLFRATAHAGVCKWGKHEPKEGKNGWSWANLASEGVEVSGLNNGQPWTEAQVQSVLDLALWRLQVYNLLPNACVRHADVAYPAKRKNDPLGLNWDWFKKELTRRFAGVSEGGTSALSASLGGPNGVSYRCSEPFRDFYDKHGGLLVFGFVTSDQFSATDPTGEQCQYLRCENGVIKYKPSEPEPWQLRLAPLAEAVRI